MIGRALFAAAILAAAAAAAGARADAPEPQSEPDGYRMEAFRAPVPDTLTGATVLDDEAAHALWSTGEAAFIDVLPRAPKPENLPEGTIWREKPHLSIPGSIWLPNVGYGALHETMHAYFRAGLSAATEGDLSHPVVFFCLADCWMSWNAAKRALEYGYAAVYWYPDGADGWAFYEWPTEKIDRYVAP